MLLQIITGIICAAIFAVSLATYGVLDAQVIAYSFAIWAVLCMFLSKKKSYALTGSILLLTLIAYSAVSFTGIAQEEAVTPEQYLAEYNPELGLYAFKKSTSITIDEKEGLLARLSPGQPTVERDVTFKTDSNGLRNSSDLTDQKTVLIGGSFIYGAGSTQEDIVSEIVEDEFGAKTYSIAPLGGIDAQALLAFNLTSKMAQKPSGILFMFEGEDFTPFNTTPAYPFQRVVRFLANNDLARFLRPFKNTLPQVAAETSPVVQYTLGSSSLAFSQAYVESTLATSYTADPKLEELITTLGKTSGLVKAVVFIPTKLRVYAPLLSEDAPKVPESPKLAHLRSIAKKAGVDVYDLTPHLQAAAVHEWGENKEFIWWRDDVVWNEKGAKVAAELVNLIINNKL